MGPIITQINGTVTNLKEEYKNILHICHPRSVDSLSFCPSVTSFIQWWLRKDSLRAMWIHIDLFINFLTIVLIRYDGKESAAMQETQV